MERLERLFFGFFSYLLTAIDQAEVQWILGMAAGLLLLPSITAFWLQFCLNRSLSQHPHRPSRVGRREAFFSIAFPIAMGVSVVRWILTRIRSRFHRDDQAESATPVAIRVATLGPSFFLSGLITAGLFWLVRLSDPLLARLLHLSSGASFWELCLLGRRRELAWILPLEDHPWPAMLLILALWLTIWWSLGNIIRGVWFRSQLQRNHGETRDQDLGEVLLLWRSWFGVSRLIAPQTSYLRWASWAVAVAICLLGLSAITLGGQRAAVASGDFAVALILVLSWSLHLSLRGVEAQPSAVEVESKKSDAENGPGWPEVAAELTRLTGRPAPDPGYERAVRVPGYSSSWERSKVLSPLLHDLQPATENEAAGRLRLSSMQQQVLESLSRLGFVHLPKPQEGDALTLPLHGQEQALEPGRKPPRNQVVLAPEGAGKTTLAVLAAANHSLVHSRGTLMVTRSEDQAAALEQAFQARAQPSTLRWNLRLRRVGRDFAGDLSQDIIPDVVIVSLDQLVTGLLANTDVYRPFLEHVGLVIVDDIETFLGPVEIHAQLAFRRLRLLFQRLLEVEQLGPENLPVMLVLGSRTMHQTSVWARGICGIEAVVRELSGVDEATADSAGEGEPVVQKVAQLSEWAHTTGRPVSVQELVGACESQGVPWHYRACGDGRRGQGRSALLLRHEPRFDRPSPSDACVLILEGRWSEVSRELRRLPMAGARSGRSEIVVFAVLDPEEARSCAALDGDFGLNEDYSEDLSDLASRLRSLPLPFLRPPSSVAVQNHLLADLLQHWVEVKDLIDTFEAPIAGSLRDLQEQGMLFIDERHDVKPELKTYETKVYVRASASALEAAESESAGHDTQYFSPYDKVRQVEMTSTRAVTVRNRVHHQSLGREESESAGLVYYPGRIFEQAQGRFIVVDRLKEKEHPGPIIVEPLLRDDVSSPRRSFQIEPNRAADQVPFSEPEVVLLGKDPVAVGLVAVCAEIQTVATYRLDRHSGAIRSREIHPQERRQRFSPGPLETVSLVMVPNPELLSPEAPRLVYGEARLLSMLLRFLLPLIYRGARDRLEIALKIDPEIYSLEKAGLRDLWSRLDEVLAPDEGFYILDLHHGGSGIAAALHREGLGLPLRLCRHYLRHLKDFHRFRRLYDHWAHYSEIFADSEDSLPRAEEPARNEPDEVRVNSDPPAGRETVNAAEHEASRPVVSTGEEASEDAENKNDPSIRWEIYRQGLHRWLDSRVQPEAVEESSLGKNDAGSLPEGEAA